MFIACANSILPTRFGRVELNIESASLDLFHPSESINLVANSQYHLAVAGGCGAQYSTRPVSADQHY